MHLLFYLCFWRVTAVVVAHSPKLTNQGGKKINTSSKGQNDGHPADDVGPGEAPIQEAFAKEGNRHSGVNRQRQQSEKTCQQGHHSTNEQQDLISCHVTVGSSTLVWQKPT